jgi:hypothetical protein
MASIAPAASAEEPSSEEVDAAVRSMRETADETFASSWRKYGDQAARDGVSPTQIRQWSLWMMMGYSLGVCHQTVPGTLMADWLAAIDTLGFRSKLIGTPSYRFVEEGNRIVEHGRSNAPEDPPGTAAYDDFCKPDVAAVQRILTSSF